MKLIPYINLSGNAEEVVNFYKSVFGGTAEIMRWSEMPPNPDMPIEDEWKDKIMHCTYTINNDITIYLSDSWMEQKPANNSIFLHVQFDSEEKLRSSYEKLSRGGKVNMPVDNTFWGSVYGDLIDKFGIGWGMEYSKEK